MMVSSRLRAAVIKLVKDEDLSETIDHELFSRIQLFDIIVGS